MAEINWKSKYTELKAKYMNDVDTAYRLGCEQGMQMAQQQQAQEQAAQAQAAQQQQQGATASEGAQDNGEGGAANGEQVPGDTSQPASSELDQHIAQLEGMVKKSELTSDDLQSMRKSFEALKFGIEMKKSDAAVKGIAKAIRAKSPVTLSKSATANLSHNQKNALSMQEKIVSDIMSQWDSQETSLAKSISDIVASAGHKKD
jgi:hypothetical protein